MSKLSSETVRETIKAIQKGSKDKKRKFLESIELQIALKNYDLSKDKRFSGQVRLPYVPRPKFTVCILADAKHAEDAKKLKVEFLDDKGIAGLNKNKKAVKKLGACAFCSCKSETQQHKQKGLASKGNEDDPTCSDCGQ